MNKYLSTDFSIYASGQLIATLFHALFFIVFASILEPKSLGELSYWISIAGFFSVISRFGLPYTVTVYQAKKNQTISNQINVLGVITTSTAAIVLLQFNMWAALFSLGISLFWLNQHNLLGKKKYKLLSVTIIVQSILFLILPIVLFFMIGIVGILLGLAIANLSCSINFLKGLNIHVNSFREIKKNILVIVHNFGVDLSISLPLIVDKLLIVALYGFVINGIYQFNMQVLGGLSILPYMLYGFLLSEESSKRSNKKLILFILSTTIFIVIISIIIIPVLVPEFFPKYVEGILSLQILIISSIPLTFASVFNAKLQAKESTTVGYSIIIRISSLVLLIIILGNIWNLVGLSSAVLISTTLYTLLLGYLFKRSRNSLAS